MSRDPLGPRPVDAAGTTQPVPFESSRPHPLRSLVQLAPGRAAYGLGLRMALLITVPLAVGIAIDEVGPATLFSLGTLNASMADVGGARVSRWHALSAATVLNALAIGLGTITSRSIGLAIAVTFVVASGGAFANLFGNVASNVGFVVTILLIIGIGLPGDGSVALERMWLVAAGGVCATVVTLVLWPVRPYAAASASVAASYRAVAGLVRSLTSGPGEDPAAVTMAAGEARTQIEAARSVVTLTRAGRHGASPTSTRLLALVVAAGRLVSEAEGLPALVTGAASTGVDRAHVDRAIAALATAIEGLSSTIKQHPSPTEGVPIDLSPLDRSLAEALGWAMFKRTSNTFDEVIALRPVIDTLSAMATVVHTTVETVEGVVVHPPGGPDVAQSTIGEDHHRSWWERLATTWQTARTNLTPSSAIFRHAMRYGTATAIGVSVALAFQLTKGYWIPLTVAVVLRPFTAATFERTLLRVAGTIAGGIIAAAVVSGVHGSVASVVLLFAFSALAFSLLPLNYGLAIVFLTPTVIVLVSAGAPNNWEVAAHRVVNTLIGAAIALAVAYLLWPRAERRSFPDTLTSAVLALGGHLDVVLAAYIDGPTAQQRVAIASAHQQAGLAVDNAQVGFQRLLGGGRPHHVEQTSVLWSITDTSRWVFLETSALQEHLGVMGGSQTPGDLDAVRRHCAQMLIELAQSLAAHQMVRPHEFPLNSLNEAILAIRRSTDAAQDQRRAELATGVRELTPAALSVRDFAEVSGALEHIAAWLDNLRSDIDDLAGQQAPPRLTPQRR
ncbi:MAG: hypothetical protein QOJ44_2236 [Acidimicrobiaceae bacterium]|nr:hypothetical protein [Acidimicrobiaceae bacterium]